MGYPYNYQQRQKLDHAKSICQEIEILVKGMETRFKKKATEHDNIGAYKSFYRTIKSKISNW